MNEFKAREYGAYQTDDGAVRLGFKGDVLSKSGPTKPPVVNDTGIRPTEFKVLIQPNEVEEVTKGGIILAAQTKDSEKYATIEGLIIAVSHLAFSYATAAEWDGHKPGPGDRVIFAKYAGIRHKTKDGQEYLLVNDKDIVATIEE